MEYKRKIFGYECDVYGHLNNANYLHLYEEARADALEKMKLPIRELNNLGFQIYLTNIELEFIKAIALEEIVMITTEVSKTNRLHSVWIQKMINEDQEVCNIATVKGVFVKNGKPNRLPKDLYETIRFPTK